MPLTPGNTAETRALPLRRRADLICREQQIGGSRYWHVKDPVSLHYFQLKPEEHAVLQMLDGTVSLREIRRRFEQQFAPQRLSPAQLQSFLASLHTSGLILSDGPGQSDYLLNQSRNEQRRKLLGQLTNLLAIRFRGFDPHRFLNWLTPRAGFLFNRWCVAICLGVMLSALLLAALRLDTLATRLPRFHEFFSASNLIGIAITLAVTKILHELGHAVACRHFGGECHEMGFMLLVFTPCLYCNVSDAWMLPSRRHRIMISLAGMYVELLLASGALYLWWFSLPGVFNALCLNVVFVCSVTTILFNGNPLLRYDGYYVLSDLVEIPNLRQQAGALIRHELGLWFLDAELANRRLLPESHRGFLAVWFVAALAYRVVVIWGILWFIHAVLEPYGLEPVAFLLGAVSVAGLLLSPILQFVSLLTNPFWSRTVNWPRFRIRSLVVVGALAGVASFPFPFSVKAPAVIQAEAARSVYIEVPGCLVEATTAGQRVKEGDVLARLLNLDVAREIVVLEGRVAQLERQLEDLQTRRIGESVESLIPTTQQELAHKRDELRQRQQDRDKLVVLAPRSGVVLPAPARPVPNNRAENRELVTGWSGTPLDPENRGTTLETGTELCAIAESGRFEAVVAVDERSVEFVAAGQSITLLVDHLSDRELRGTIVELAEIDLDVAPRELLQHDDFPTRIDADGVPRPVTTAYQARVAFDSGPDAASLIQRGTARARIDAAPQSLATRGLRFIQQTFRFR